MTQLRSAMTKRLRQGLKLGFSANRLMILLILVGFFFLMQFVPKAIVSPDCFDSSNAKVEGGIISSSTFNNQTSFQSDKGCIAANAAIIELNTAEVDLSCYYSIHRVFYEQGAAGTRTLHLGDQNNIPGRVHNEELIHIKGTDNSPTVKRECNPPNNPPVTYNGDLHLSGGNPIVGDGVSIIFVDNDLFIESNINYVGDNADGFGPNNSGLIFVVGGKINIDPSVTNINAVLIASGQICTSFQSFTLTCQSNLPTNTDVPLAIHGNVIGLSEGAPPSFVRDLAGSATSNLVPSEQVQLDPKYYALLRRVFAQKLVFLTEGTDYGSGLP